VGKNETPRHGVGMNLEFHNGLSGCQVRLLDGVVVKSCSPPYESRLESQCKKQKSFRNYDLKNIEVPTVIDKGIGWFSMEYAGGADFFSFLEKASKQDLDSIVDTLSCYFDFFEKRSRPSSDTTRCNIVNKIYSMQKTGLSFSILENLLVVQEDLDIQSLPKSMCHGDLTFSNILFTKNKLWLIDFLDTFVDSYILDFVKLKQDLYYNWSMKTQNKSSLRLHQTKKYIWCSLCERKQNVIENEWFDFFDTLNILRIEPYITDDKHRKVFSEILKRTPYYENTYRSNGR